MPKYYEETTTFKYTWEQVAKAFWLRYPNPSSGHVLTEDTVLREVHPGGYLISKRLLSKTNTPPKWARNFVGSNQVFIVEESHVDPMNKTLTTYTRNLGYAKVLSIVEKVTYKESKTQPGFTIAVRSAWIDSQVKGLSRAIRAFGYERFKKNCHKMVNGFNYVLNNLYNPGPAVQAATNLTVSTGTKLKDAAKKTSELAKAKAAPIYASLHPNQS